MLDIYTPANPLLVTRDKERARLGDARPGRNLDDAANGARPRARPYLLQPLRQLLLLARLLGLRLQLLPHLELRRWNLGQLGRKCRRDAPTLGTGLAQVG